MPPEGTKKRIEEDIVHEYPAIGKYRIRVLRKEKPAIKDAAGKVTRLKKVTTSFDVREYVDSDKFEGFTRRGIRLAEREELEALRGVIDDAINRGWI